jgi:hypothetical protein
MALLRRPRYSVWQGGGGMRTRKTKQTQQRRPGHPAPQLLEQVMRPPLDVARLLQVGGERIAIEFPERSGKAFMAEFVE